MPLICKACGQPKGRGYGCAVLPQAPSVLAGLDSGRAALPVDPVDLDALAKAQAEIRRLTKARAKLAERLSRLAKHVHGELMTHRPYSLEECQFVGCRENAYALRLGKPKRAGGGGD